MDKKYLHRVLDQIVSETKIDLDEKKVYFTFSPSPFFLFPDAFFSPFSISYLPLFFDHCRDIYGLNDDEIDYVWDEYKEIILDKIESNGL